MFVAYWTLDTEGLPWVRNEFLPRVEEEWGMTAFILDRDALVGPFLEEVTHGIENSDKKLFVITDNFIQNYHWPIVLHWCVDSGLNSLIFVLIDILSIDRLPPSLARVAMSLETNYPTHVLYFKIGEENPDFWQNLNLALGGDQRNFCNHFITHIRTRVDMLLMTPR